MNGRPAQASAVTPTPGAMGIGFSGGFAKSRSNGSKGKK
jgi:hypothetical protein